MTNKCKQCDCELVVPDTWLQSSKDTNQYSCRECKNKYLREWRAKNPGAYKEWKYGVSQEEYENKLLEQEGKCAICSTTEPKGRRGTWHIDHDHVTGKFRGLLCWLCNSALGKFKDDADIIEKASAYLRRNKEVKC